MAVRRKKIEEMVEALLKEHKIYSAPIDVEALVRAQAIKIRHDEVDDELSGFLLRDVEKKEIILGVNSRHHENRIRFTMAHELGHFFLHEGEKVHLDSDKVAYKINHRDQNTSKGEDDSEKEANYFAAELLMPTKFLAEDLTGIKLDLLDEGNLVLTELAAKYKVSVQALTFRLANLGYISL